MVLTDPWLVRWIKACLGPFQQSNHRFPLAGMSPATMTRRFRKILSALQIPPDLFSLGSLRPGGATWEYINNYPISYLKFRGRWAAESSLEHYVQECAAYLGFHELSAASRASVERLERLFSYLVPAYVWSLE